MQRKFEIALGFKEKYLFMLFTQEATMRFAGSIHRLALFEHGIRLIILVHVGFHVHIDVAAASRKQRP